jgi:hypothetical protein
MAEAFSSKKKPHAQKEGFPLLRSEYPHLALEFH